MDYLQRPEAHQALQFARLWFATMVNMGMVTERAVDYGCAQATEFLSNVCRERAVSDEILEWVRRDLQRYEPSNRDPLFYPGPVDLRV